MKKDIQTEIEIDAPVEKVWGILTDFEKFSLWNPFVTRVEGKPGEGETIKIDVQIPDGKMQKFTPVILKAEPNKELRWAGTVPPNLFRGEHFYILESLSENKTRFIHGEHFSGLLVRLIWFIQGEKIKKGYKLMNESLKKRAEKLK